MAALTTTMELQRRLDFDLNSGDRDLTPVAQAALEDLSADALHYGKPAWTSATCPEIVKSVILRAAVRYLKNPDGFNISRAGDETVGWSVNDDQAASAHFTESEISQIQRAASGNGSLPSIGSFGTYGWNSQNFQPLPEKRYTDFANLIGAERAWY